MFAFAQVGTTLLFVGAVLGTGASAHARGIPLFIQTGYASEEMGQIKPEHQQQLVAAGENLKAGYVYQRVACFWINIWTWGGEYALFRDAGSNIEYQPLSKEELADLIGEDPENIKPPLAYRVPFLFRIVGYAAVLGGVFLALGLALTFADKRKLKELRRDPTYQRAFEQLEKRLGPPEETTRISPKRKKKAIAEGADYLEKHDIVRADAEKHLELYIREAYPNADTSGNLEEPPSEEEPPAEERLFKRKPGGPPRA